MTEDVTVVKSASHSMHSSKMKKKKAIMGSKMNEEDEEMVDCKPCKGTGKIDGEECEHCDGTGEHPKSEVDEAKMDPVGQADADIDNDGDEDDSDEYLHKKRKAIKKNMKKSNIKEWVAMGSKAPGKEAVKNAMEAYGLADHYLQISQRDELFGRKDKAEEHLKLAASFYEHFKQLESEGDDSAENVFKNEEVSKRLESFSESVTTQTKESSDQNPNIPYPGDEYKRKMTSKPYPGNNQKASNPRQYAIDKAKKEKERDPNSILGRLAKSKRDKETVQRSIDKHLSKTKTGGVQNEDFREVQFEGETVYESFDSTNLPEHTPEVVEFTPDNYGYNRSAWHDALAEVNRYKGKSGHRVTQPDKSGNEHIIMN